MKTAGIIFVVLLLIAYAGVAGRLLLARRSTDATIPFTGKISGKTAVVYYSQSNVHNTETVARWIAKHTGGDLIALEMSEPYPEPYPSTLKAVGKDRKAGTLPALREIPKLDGYDLVFLGSPIWYGTYALPVGTFLKGNPLQGKTVAPFCTHGGGGCGRFIEELRKACPGARVLDGLAIRGSNQIERRLGFGVGVRHTEDDVVTWLNSQFSERAR